MRAKHIWLAILFCTVAVFSQEDKQFQMGTSQRYLVLDTVRTATLQRELDAASAAGYRIAFGDAAHGILILEKMPERYQYRVLQNIKKEFEPAVADAWGAVPATFSSDAFRASALIMEKPAGGAAKHDYLALETVRTKTLQKELNEATVKGYEFAAMSTYGPNSVLMEKRTPDAPGVPDRYLLLATKRTSTMQKEINEAVGKGYAVAAGSGGGELMIIMEKAPKPPEYELQWAAKTTNLEKKINEAAARGFRPVPRTLLAIDKSDSLSFSLAVDETCVVMEKTAQPETFTYKIIGTSRASTFKKELAQAAAEGFELIGFTLSYHEQVGLLRRATSVAAVSQP